MIKRRGAPGRRTRPFALEALETRELLTTIVVTSPIDGAAGSLRDAVGRASAGDVITFAKSLRGATLHLTGGEIDVTKALTIQGTRQTLDADQGSRILRIEGAKATLSGLTFRDGRASFDDLYGYAGGAILASGSDLVLNNCTFQSDQAVAGTESLDGNFVAPAFGGAVFADSGTVGIANCVFRRDAAVGGGNTSLMQSGRAAGGAVFVNESPLTIRGCSFEGNVAKGGDSLSVMTKWPSSLGGSGGGGAIYAMGSPVSASGTRFVSNRAIGGKGLDGSLAQAAASPEVGDGGVAGAGAILVEGGTDASPVLDFSVLRCTFQGNAALGGNAGTPDVQMTGGAMPGGQGGEAQGGAVLAVGNIALLINNSVLDGNSATGGGAGPNPAGLGLQVGWGGVVKGGAVFSEKGHSVTILNSRIVHSLALGGQGSDSPADGSSYAGAGGWAYGGGVYVNNGRGGAGTDPYVEPVLFRDTTFSGNSVQGGEPGKGVLADIHAGGGAQGGAADLSGKLGIDILRSNWTSNRAVGGTETLASGGALATPFGAEESHTTIVGGQFRSNQAIGGKDARNASYREGSGGAFMINSPNTVVVGVRFQSNAAIGGADTGSGYAGTGKGGAVYIVGQHPTTEFDACSFLSNQALGGTAAGAGNGGSYNGQGLGGAIYAENGDLTVRGGSFLTNLARGSNAGSGRDAKGGAIFASPIASPPDYDYQTNTHFTGVIFKQNQAVASGDSVASGGAVFNGGNVLTDVGSRFLHNQAVATDGTAYGGAIVHEHEIGQTGTPYVPAMTLTATEVNGNLAIGQAVPQGPAASGFGGGIAFLNDPIGVLRLVSYRKNRASTMGNDVWGTYHESES
ncbi:hypothetical protein [Aquisphaera insulae]|uniref:hypothetical protein n=1 Tax=Aquisphaera insulae TaxID=2712864 RepID=UPI0013ECAC6A|nr:hypothetical protein [Aquisphaera insulae]